MRKLQEKDAPFMFEWMHDDNVVHDLNRNFSQMSIEDCKSFIRESKTQDKNLHFAISNDNDEYMGTVSLKNINTKIGCAEFRIEMRKQAVGKGYACYAMKEIIRVGFDKLELRKIFWCVSPNNKRAIKFYDKNGYQRIQDLSSEKKEMDYILTKYRTSSIIGFVWYLCKATQLSIT